MLRKSRKIEWTNAPDIKKRVIHLVREIDLNWINTSGMYFIRSNYSSSRAYARIWGLSKVWQMTLKQDPAYIIEVLSEKFDKLNDKEKDRVLLHELAHIPKNFSGSLLPHIRRRGKRNFHDRVEELFAQYLRSRF
ncbi:MAG: Metallopeptidase-like protein [Microgenomates group bacterium GW2011_GWC1_37_8]|uniref:Metallopeptidase-like protein n=1 Tax=Candidatus Woesebacteria bacterium GW2011_GWB1_38_8 TaxID=1618570 RepID=A0A0G0L2P4_9BACT|nr:MAG: Metallopeptidase-like protein [Microgenomates group bacterium GW2011_GWC1_37_8]KKQ85277.1 MAG: Metallopeptidase-like protein [Candidatus Woesebacteria bacterium GW2011_GWB1_38_8]